MPDLLKGGEGALRAPPSPNAMMNKGRSSTAADTVVRLVCPCQEGEARTSELENVLSEEVFHWLATGVESRELSNRVRRGDLEQLGRKLYRLEMCSSCAGRTMLVLGNLSARWPVTFVGEVVSAVWGASIEIPGWLNFACWMLANAYGDQGRRDAVVALRENGVAPSTARLELIRQAVAGLLASPIVIPTRPWGPTIRRGEKR